MNTRKKRKQIKQLVIKNLSKRNNRKNEHIYHLLPSKIGYTYAPILVIARLLTLKPITVLSLRVDLNHHL
jgi:hypothetical protein